ncbi:MAG: ABC transporter permease [SAR324 cluster bacterium]|nr:ABC transporter permease [SAR324 cluster bacterium]
MRYELAISLRYLLSRKRERSISLITGFAVSGVVLGVTALVVAMSVMNGYQANMIRAMAGALPHVSVLPDSSEGFHDPQALTRDLIAVMKPESVSPFLLHEALVTNTGQKGTLMHGVMLRGVDPSVESGVADFLAFLSDGSAEWDSLHPDERLSRARKVLHLLDRPIAPGLVPVLLSPNLAHDLGLELGDLLVPLTFPKRGEGFSPVPAEGRLQLVGYFHTGILAFDELVVLINVDAIEAVYPGTNYKRSIGLRLHDPLEAATAARVLRSLSRLGDESFRVYSWLESNSSLFQVIRVQKVMLFVVLMLIVVIAFFGIIGAMVMLVAEKARDISVLKSLGARGSSIRTLFIIQGLIIGTAGTAIGVALGLAICWALDTFQLIEIPPGVYPGSDRIPVLVSLRDMMMVIGGTMVVSLLATVYPAHKAMRFPLVQGLRYK